MLKIGLLGAVPLSAWTQPQTHAFPTKPITMIVGFAAGGGTDTAARLLAQDLAVELGQSVVVDNRAGAGGMIGAAAGAKAPADGYTLFFGSGSELAVLPALKKGLAYDTLKSFTPVTQVGTVSFMLVAHPSVPANSVGELIALGRAKPGQVSFASYGVGSTNHLIGELFAIKTRTKLLHVPYKGSAAAATDLISGEVQIAFDTVSVMLPHVQAGRLKALGVLSAQRAAQAADLPTMAEAGVQDLVVDGWLGVMAPIGTPDAIVQRLDKAIGNVLAKPRIAETLTQRGVKVSGDGPEPFRAFIKRELEKWRSVAQSANIQLD
ncbi:Bug family tripartite tricarboxylate transporter substrate binding protein [Variovorax sp. RT4R15]|uniref:Bug family tripartite tricarboxylate transporter substrate binding protein n=1 Tax=Variovorax sp. RT4R15 TaxID=3443737 RepID=UPI003F47B89D